MKMIKRVIFFCLITLLKLARLILPKKKKFAVVAPAKPGSLGDQALMQGIYHVAQQHSCDLFEVMVFPTDIPNSFLNYRTEYSKTAKNTHTDILRVCWHSLRFERFIIVGADTLDGSYNIPKNITWLKIANAVAYIGLPTSIVSFSFSKDPKPEVVKEIKNSHPKVNFYSREEFSRGRFETATQRSCNLSADLAFLMQPYTDIPRIKEIAKQLEDKTEQELVIGLNINTINRAESKTSIVNSFTHAVKNTLLEHNQIRFIFIPHDFREGQSDEDVLLEVKDSLPSELQTRVLFAKGPYNAWDAKFLAKQCDLVITGRMHLAIASLSQQVPVFCFVYKNKFEGLMKHLEITKNCIDSEEMVNKNATQDFFNLAITTYEQQKANIESNLDRVKGLAKTNY